jgi:hypothetical protein
VGMVPVSGIQSSLGEVVMLLLLLLLGSDVEPEMDREGKDCVCSDMSSALQLCTDSSLTAWRRMVTRIGHWTRRAARFPVRTRAGGISCRDGRKDKLLI